MEDREILALFLERSEQAIPKLSEKYHALCLRMAGNLLTCESDAEECISDAYLALWNTIPPEQPPSLPAYLLGILRNLCRDRFDYLSAARRDFRQAVCLEELLPCLPNAPGEQQTLDALVIRDTLNVFLLSLPKFDRYIFLRRYYYQDTCRELAKSLGMSESALANRLGRLRTRLKERLIKEGINV